MAENFHELSIAALRAMYPVTVGDELSEDVFVSDVRHDGSLPIFKYPCRFDGYCSLYCKRGELQIEMNLNTYKIGPGSIFIYTPGNIIKASSDQNAGLKDSEFTVIAVSREFMSGMKVDLSRLFSEAIKVLENPCIKLNEDELSLTEKYFDLFKQVASMNLPNVKDALMSLISSNFYVMASMMSSRIHTAVTSMPPVVNSRSRRTEAVFQDFMELVKDNHMSERQIAFYADRLYLTPKYLSKLVKSVCGRSAHELIDDYVILEAKNLLRYSDLTVKEIVYELNFPNQTTFYRFFKSKAGMTPTDYRKD